MLAVTGAFINQARVVIGEISVSIGGAATFPVVDPAPSRKWAPSSAAYPSGDARVLIDPNCDSVAVVEIGIELRCVREIKQRTAHRLTTRSERRIRYRCLRTDDHVGTRRISESRRVGRR